LGKAVGIPSRTLLLDVRLVGPSPKLKLLLLVLLWAGRSSPKTWMLPSFLLRLGRGPLLLLRPLLLLLLTLPLAALLLLVLLILALPFLR
jgi:hypothetical protein